MARTKPYHHRNGSYRRKRRSFFLRNDLICFYCGADLVIDRPEELSELEFERGDGVIRGGRLVYRATLEHVVPASLGGLFNDDDCVVACPECNTTRGNRPLREFFSSMLGPPEVTGLCLPEC